MSGLVGCFIVTHELLRYAVVQKYTYVYRALDVMQTRRNTSQQEETREIMGER